MDAEQAVARRRLVAAAIATAAILLGICVTGLAVKLSDGPPPMPPADQRAYRVPINTADAATLQLLPQIGPSRAEAIVRERAAGGPFRDVEDLTRVHGIGDRRARTIAPYLRFDDPDDVQPSSPDAASEPGPASDAESGSSGVDQSMSPVRQTTRSAPTPTSSFIPPRSAGSTITVPSPPASG